MYRIYVSFECIDGKREEFLKEVKSQGILDAIRAEDGCLCYDYYLSAEDENKILLIEYWESKSHQEIHIGQPHMDKLRALNSKCIKSSHLGEFEFKD